MLFSGKRIRECVAHQYCVEALSSKTVRRLMLEHLHTDKYQKIMGNLAHSIHSHNNDFIIMMVMLQDRAESICQQFNQAQRHTTNKIPFNPHRELTFTYAWEEDYELSTTFSLLVKAYYHCSCRHHQQLLPPETYSKLRALVDPPQPEPLFNPKSCSPQLLDESLGDTHVVDLPQEVVEFFYKRRFPTQNGTIPVRVLTPENIPSYWPLLPRLRAEDTTPTLLVTENTPCTVYGENLAVLSHTGGDPVLHHMGDTYIVNRESLKNECPILYNTVTKNTINDISTQNESLGSMVLDTHYRF